MNNEETNNAPTFEIWIKDAEDYMRPVLVYRSLDVTFDTSEEARKFGEREVAASCPWMIVRTHFCGKKRIVHRTRTMISGSPQNDIHIQDVSF